MDAEIAELESRLEAVGTAPEDAPARVDALVDLAWALRMSESERANRLAGGARELALSIGYKLGQARAARVLGMTVGSYTQNMGGHIAYGEEAKALFDEVGDQSGSAASRDFLAGIYEYMGELSAGMELASEALSIAREIGDPVRQGYALSNVGGILAASGDVDAGYEHLWEALGLFESIDDAMGIGSICEKLSKLCRQNGRMDEALRYARRLHDMAERTGEPFDRASASAALGELEQEKGNRGEAERLFRQSLDAYDLEEPGFVAGVPARVSLGRLLADRGALAEAESMITKALDGIAAYQISCPADEASAREALAEVSERQGDFPNAIAHLREVVRLRERAARKEAGDRLAQFEARAEMKTARQEAEINRLQFVELSKMQSELVEAEKMAQLGTLAAGTAHELNSPLGVLQSNLSSYAKAAFRLSELARSDRAHPDATEKLTEVLSACQRTSDDAIARIAAVAESFKRFTSLDLSEKRIFNVLEGLEAAIALLRPNLPEGITLQRRFDPVPDIEGWPGQLNQAFMTVLLNATQAIEGQGTVTVETRTAADMVVVRIADTGRGMTEPERARIFDVGWSADGKRTKMRMGLSAAHATVERHAGRVEVDTAPGKGTVFSFSFPVQADAESGASDV